MITSNTWSENKFIEFINKFILSSEPTYNGSRDNEGLIPNREFEKGLIQTLSSLNYPKNRKELQIQLSMNKPNVARLSTLFRVAIRDYIEQGNAFKLKGNSNVLDVTLRPHKIQAGSKQYRSMQDPTKKITRKWKPHSIIKVKCNRNRSDIFTRGT